MMTVRAGNDVVVVGPRPNKNSGFSINEPQNFFLGNNELGEPINKLCGMYRAYALSIVRQWGKNQFSVNRRVIDWRCKFKDNNRYLKLISSSRTRCLYSSIQLRTCTR